LGDRDVLRGLDLDVAANEVVAVLGPSGAGKTTLLRLIAGLDRPDAGTIHVHGRPASAGKVFLAPHARGLGMVFQTPSLWPHMTVAGNITYALADLSRAARAERLAELTRQLGLEGLEKRYPDQLSGGEARRVGLARAMAAKPRLILFDEPLTNLDRELKERLIEHVARAMEGAAAVYVTHDEEEAAALAARRLVLRNGRLERVPLEQGAIL
jgi:iron(III) transport system ATP-binding protein